MGFVKSSLLSVLLVFLTGFALLIPPIFAADIFSLEFKGCSKTTFEDISGFQETVTSLFSSLIAQSSSARFFKTTSGSGQTSASGLFQCRGDLTNTDCNSCVRQIADKSSDWCHNAVAARIQLAGCYAHYEIGGSQQISGTELIYKSCSGSEASYEDKRDTAFSQVQTGIAGGSGFYATTYQSVYAIAQCEGDLSVADCGECVKEAVQKAEEECGKSISGQVYLNRCYVSYRYYPNGVSGHSSGSGSQTGKTVAIVFGGAFALFFIVICLLFLGSLRKKRDDY